MPTFRFATAGCRYVYSSALNDAFRIDGPGLSSGRARTLWGRLAGALARLARRAVVEAEDACRARRLLGPSRSAYPGTAERTLGQRHEHLLLNLTEECNFRCRYCLYGGGYPGRREHARRHMPPKLALAAVERFLTGRAEQCHISFYGGEPLLRMDVIRRVVAFVDTRLAPGETRPFFALTTNGSLLEGETARYLAENAFTVTVSLDGPASVHDARRRDALGRPTHRRVLENVERLAAAWPGWARTNLRFSAVCLDEQDLPAMHRFFSGHEVLSGCAVNVAFVLPGGVERQDVAASWSGNGPDVLAELEGRYLEALVAGNTDRFLSALFEAPYRAYFERHGAKAQDRLQGCCVPGMRRLFVAADGALYPCEKLDSGYPLGHVSGWLDPVRTAGLHEAFLRLTESCRACWAWELCTMCYASFFDGRTLNPALRNAECAAFKDRLRAMLEGYHTLLERDSGIPGKRFGG